jgi:hypothetical protein
MHGGDDDIARVADEVEDFHVFAIKQRSIFVENRVMAEKDERSVTEMLNCAGSARKFTYFAFKSPAIALKTLSIHTVPVLWWVATTRLYLIYAHSLLGLVELHRARALQEPVQSGYRLSSGM